MDKQATAVIANARAQLNALKATALEQRKAKYKAEDADVANAELDKKLNEVFTSFRSENEKAKLENINNAYAKAVAEITAEYEEADSLLAKFLGGN